jgi:dGTPase
VSHRRRIVDFMADTTGADGLIPPTAREAIWAATMSGHGGPIRRAHEDALEIGTVAIHSREAREAEEDKVLAPGATRAIGAGRRVRPEEPDIWRTCFERDRDRILHSRAFRRLSGKTQVFIFPTDHQRTRLTHALEVAQVAVAIASSLRLNIALAEAIALGHDCGHGPGGHASEEAFAPFLDEGFDHARWGADVVLPPLNLTLEVLDGVRNHSWSRPTPETPEAEVVAWADRIAYVCHDFEDAVRSEVVTPNELPDIVRRLCGTTRSQQLGAFITAVVEQSASSAEIAMPGDLADALAAFRRFNYERVYLRPESRDQALLVIEVLRDLVDYFAAHPHPSLGFAPSSEQAVRAAVDYVSGMTDRFAFGAAIARLGFSRDRLPRGVDFEVAAAVIPDVLGGNLADES